MEQRKRFVIFLTEAEHRAIKKEANKLEKFPSEFVRDTALEVVGLPTPRYRKMKQHERVAAGYNVGATE